ncbi:MAG: hypothetical protein ACP5HK_06545, partial [Acidilobus sp.]
MGPEADLFPEYNVEFANRINSTIAARAHVLVVLGPPGSGKSFFAINVLRSGGALEAITGFNLTPVSAGQKHGVPLGEGPAGLDKAGLASALKEVFDRLARWISQAEEVDLEGFSEEERRLLRDHLPSRVPRAYVERLRELRSRYGPIVPYKVPWDVDSELRSADVREAVLLVKRYFNRREGNHPIRWLSREYVPPGLIREVVDIAGREGKDRAEEFVRGQAEAYSKVIMVAVGERDEEFGGFLALSAVDLARYLSRDGLSGLVSLLLGGLTGALASVALTGLLLVLFYGLTRERRGFEDLVEMRVEWGRLSEHLRWLVASKVALQLGISPREALDAINGLTGMDLKELERRFDSLRDEVERLRERMKDVESLVNVYREPRELNVVFEGEKAFVAPVKTVEVRYPFIDPGGFEGLSGQVSELMGKVRELIARGRGVLIVHGPHGIGKSTLVRYVLARLLRDGEVMAVIDLSSKGLREVNDALYNARGIRYVALYDPSSLETYQATDTGRGLGGPRPVIAEVVEEISERVGGEFVHQVPVVAVIPDPVYDSLSDEVKGGVESVGLSLSDAGFIKEIIKGYSGCELDGEALDRLTGQVLGFSEGYTLIARLVGEAMRGGCSSEGVEGLLRSSQGRAQDFMVSWVNDFLGVRAEGGGVNTLKVKALSEVLAVREALKGGTSRGEHIASPDLIERLAYW